MRLEEWQKFIESQFLEDEAAKPEALPEPTPELAVTEPQKVAIVEVRSEVRAEEKTNRPSAKPETPLEVAPVAKFEVKPQALPEPKQMEMFPGEVSERVIEQPVAVEIVPVKPEPKLETGFVAAGKVATLDSPVTKPELPIQSDSAASLPTVTPTTPAKSTEKFFVPPVVKPVSPIQSPSPVLSNSSPNPFQLDTSMNAEIPDFALYLKRDSREPANPVVPEPLKTEPTPTVAISPPLPVPEKTREATVTLRATVSISEPPFVNHSPFQREDKANPSDIPLPGRIQKQLEPATPEAIQEPTQIQADLTIRENATAPLAPFVVAEPSPVRVKPKTATRGKNARNVAPQKPGAGLSAAELWATVPKHVQTLLAMERIEEQSEVAQNSYKRPFAEKRRELIERLLDPVLSLEDTARLLNVCPTTVRRYTNKGILTYYRKEPENPSEQKMLPDKETRQRRFRLSDILAFLESQ